MEHNIDEDRPWVFELINEAVLNYSSEILETYNVQGKSF